MKKGFIYILTNHTNSVLYIGVTSNLVKRIYEHKQKVIEGFTQKYNCNKLVYYEVGDDISECIKREKQLKNWHKEWKWNLIRENNPELKDLYDEIA